MLGGRCHCYASLGQRQEERTIDQMLPMPYLSWWAFHQTSKGRMHSSL